MTHVSIQSFEEGKNKITRKNEINYQALILFSFSYSPSAEHQILLIVLNMKIKAGKKKTVLDLINIVH